MAADTLTIRFLQERHSTIGAAGSGSSSTSYSPSVLTKRLGPCSSRMFTRMYEKHFDSAMLPPKKRYFCALLHATSVALNGRRRIEPLQDRKKQVSELWMVMAKLYGPSWAPAVLC